MTTKDYFVRSNFTAADQTYTTGQNVGALDVGMVDGVVVVTDTGASQSVSIASNQLVITNTDWDNAFVMGPKLPLDQFIGIQTRVSVLPASGESNWGIRSNPFTPSGIANVGLHALSNVLWVTFPVGNNSQGWFAANITPSADVETLLVMGGYDINGIPWDGVTVGDYLYGAAMYVLNTGGGYWQLVGKTGLYDNCHDPIFPNLGAHGNTIKFSNWLIKDADWSASAIPTFRDTSVASGDTYTMVANGYIDCGPVTLPSAGVIRVMFRRTDDNNTDIMEIASTGVVKLIKKISGSETTLATTGSAYVANNDRVQIISDGNGLQVVNGTHNTVFGTVYSGTDSAQATATGVKVSDLGTGGVLAYIAGWPIRTTVATTLPPIASSISYANGFNPLTGGPTIQILCEGDSLWDGNDFRRMTSVQILQGMMGGSIICQHLAVGGSTLNNVGSRIAADLAYYSASYYQNLYILWAGTNSFFTDAWTANQALFSEPSSAQNTLAQFLAHNFVIEFVSMADRNQTGGALTPTQMAARKNVYNPGMQSYMVGKGGYADCGALITADNASNNGVVFDNTGAVTPPMVHLNYYGAGLASRAIYNTIGNLPAQLTANVTFSTTSGQNDNGSGFEKDVVFSTTASFSPSYPGGAVTGSGSPLPPRGRGNELLVINDIVG